MVAVILAMMLISSPAAAQMVQGEIFVYVSPPPATISQSPDGTITTSGEQPLYCTTDSTGTMCYY